jgi:hypothetical protein
MRGEIAGGEAHPAALGDPAMRRRSVVERQRGRPAIATASSWDAALFGAGGVPSALTMHTASQRASLLPSARNSRRRGHRAFFRRLLQPRPDHRRLAAGVGWKRRNTYLDTRLIQVNAAPWVASTIADLACIPGETDAQAVTARWLAGAGAGVRGPVCSPLRSIGASGDVSQ